MFKPKLFTYLCYEYFSKQTFNSYLYLTRYAQLLYTKMSSTILWIVICSYCYTWQNSLQLDVCQIDSILPVKEQKASTMITFLRYLSAIVLTNGERYINVTHTRLRHNYWFNYDLYRCIIMNNSMCSCGKAEDTFH